MSGNRYKQKKRKVVAHTGTKWGYKDDHHLLLEKVPPRSLIELRERLQLPEHQDIARIAIKGNTFAECIGHVAACLDIVLDGDYDGEELCALLVKALDNRRSGKPLLSLDPRLKDAELIERDGSVSLELTETQKEIEAFSLFMQEQNCQVCNYKQLCKNAGRCLDFAMPGVVQ